MAKARPTRRDKGKARPLTAIRLGGFKCFRDPVDVAIRPLTVLAGANSGGKSSLLQPLLLMKQTLEATFEADPLLLSGPLAQVEEASTLFWRGRSRKDHADAWWVELEGADHMRWNFVRRARSRGLTLSSVDHKRIGVTLGSSFSIEQALVLVQRELLPGNSEPRPSEEWLQELARMVKRGHSQSRLQTYLANDIADILQDLIHLPGLRGNPQRAYPLTRAMKRFPGPFSPYTAGVLLSWKESGADQLTAVGDDLRTLGLTWKVEPRQRGDVAVEVMIGRLPGPQQGGAQDTVNIADVGFGASQVLPVVVALQAARPGQVVHIEQPELHLHPRAQRAMAELLINAAKRGATVIVETHSHVLLTAVQLAVASGAMPAEDVALHWFERDAEGASHVRSAALDAAGAYGDWPVDFADVEMEVESAYIEAAFGKGTA